MKKNENFTIKVLLTGATGFTGSFVLRGLLAAGFHVDIIIRALSPMNMIEDIRSRIGINTCSGTTDDVMQIVSRTSPDIVIHLASMVVSEHKSDDIENLIKSNILLGTQLLEAMIENGVKYFINTGTYWEHFHDDDYSPVGLYAASKYAFQNILQYYVEAKGVNAITLKLFDAYGPNDPRAKLINLLLRASKTGEHLSMTKGEQKIDLIHVQDITAAYIAAAERLLKGLNHGHVIYGVGTGNHMSVRDVVKIFERTSGKKLNIEWGKRPYREREVMEPCRLEPIPGWISCIGLEQGVASLFSNENGC